MKYVESHIAMNIARYTGLRLGMEVKFHAFVWFVALVLGVKFSYVMDVEEKMKEENYVRIETQLETYIFFKYGPRRNGIIEQSKKKPNILNHNSIADEHRFR